MFITGGLSLAAIFEIPSSHIVEEMVSATAFFLASGLAIMVLGISALRQNLSYRKVRTAASLPAA